MPGLRAGKLRHRLDIRARVDAGRDAYGQTISTFQTIATVWGDVEPLAGREAWYAQQVEAETTHRVTLRYSAISALFTTAHQIVWQGRILEIESIRDIDGRQFKLEVMCREANDRVES